MSKIYVQTTWSKSGNQVTIKDVGGSRTILTMQSPLPNSPLHTIQDAALGNLVSEIGMGIDGTGHYYDPQGANTKELAELQIDATGIPHTIVSPYRH